MKLNNILKWDIVSLKDTINKFWKPPLSIIKDLVITDLQNKNNDIYTNTEFIVFDTETKWFADEIIEIGAIIVKNNKIKNEDGNFYDYDYYFANKWAKVSEMEKFAFFVKPKILEIPKLITELTHIDLPMILEWEKPWAKSPNKTLPDFTTALIEFIKFVNGRPMVAHNSQFDAWIFSWSVWNNVPEINKAVKEWKITIEEIKNFFEIPMVDTLRDWRSILKLNPIKNHKNSELSELFWLTANEYMLHRAYYDVIFTARVFYWLYETVYKTYNNIEIDVTIW